MARSLQIILLLVGSYCRGLVREVTPIKLLFRMIMCGKDVWRVEQRAKRLERRSG